MSHFRTYPTPIAGLALAIVSASVFWGSAFSNQRALFFIGGFALGLLLLAPLLLKFALHPDTLWQDLQHPTVGSTLPTLAMAMMFLSKTVALFSPFAASALWLLAVLMHLVFFALFSVHRLLDFKMHHLIPSWFVPPIGLVASCLTLPSPVFHPIALALLIFGIGSYFILLPILLYRLFLHEPLEAGRKPTLAIFAAPPSLCLAGCLSLLSNPNPLLVLFLFSVALLMTTTVYVLLVHLLKLGFSPAFSSYTFPLVISGTAMYKMAHWLAATPPFTSTAPFFLGLAFVEASIAGLMILYVLLHYLRYIHKAVTQPSP